MELNGLPGLDQECVSTKCMEGVGEDSHWHAFSHWSNSAVLAPYHPGTLPTAAWCWCHMQVNSTSRAYHVNCHHPIGGYHPSPLPSALPAPGVDLVWQWGVPRNSLDHTLCLNTLMLIGLAKTKKMSATVKLCLWGGDCEAKCLR